jgi:hypothetical protein
MFGEETKSTRPTHETKDYVIKVDKVIKTKNDNLLMINLDVNGVLINGCFLKEVTVKQDGQKYKAGDTCYVLQFPSEKVGDKYYNKVWFPVSNENLEDIISQVKSLL